MSHAADEFVHKEFNRLTTVRFKYIFHVNIFYIVFILMCTFLLTQNQIITNHHV